jgi:hypothetical protein
MVIKEIDFFKFSEDGTSHLLPLKWLDFNPGRQDRNKAIDLVEIISEGELRLFISLDDKVYSTGSYVMVDNSKPLFDVQKGTGQYDLEIKTLRGELRGISPPKGKFSLQNNSKTYELVIEAKELKACLTFYKTRGKNETNNFTGNSNNSN